MLRDIFRGGGAALAIGLVTIAIVLVISLVGIFGFGWLQRETADFRGDVQAVEQTKGSGAFRIAAYDHFFNLCAAVKSDEASITSLQEELKTNPRQARVEQINASMTALRSSRAEKINQYNADAAKDYTVGQFRSNNLPFRLDTTQEVTTCTV